MVIATNAAPDRMTLVITVSSGRERGDPAEEQSGAH